MRTVAEYRQFAEDCRAMAAKLTDPADKHGMELMARGWDKVAEQREAALKKGSPVTPLTDEVPTG
jgi:hypothetical protein